MPQVSLGWRWSPGCCRSLWSGLASAESGPTGRGCISVSSTSPAKGRLGGKPEVISSDSAAIRGASLDRALPCGTSLFAGQPPCHYTQSRHCAQSRKGHCGPDNELGRSHLAWDSASSGQQCSLLCFYPSLENGGQEHQVEAHRGPMI